jgi:hypothetical protein
VRDFSKLILKRCVKSNKNEKYLVNAFRGVYFTEFNLFFNGRSFNMCEYFGQEATQNGVAGRVRPEPTERPPLVGEDSANLCG